LVDRHRGPLLAFCGRLLGSRDEAADAVQQTVRRECSPVRRREHSRRRSPRATPHSPPTVRESGRGRSPGGPRPCPV
jgi:hypothetical protein